MDPLNTAGVHRRAGSSSNATPREEMGTDPAQRRPPSQINTGSTNLPIARRVPRLPQLPEAGSPPTRFDHLMAGPAGSAATAFAHTPTLLAVATVASALPALKVVGQNVGKILANPSIPASVKAGSMAEGLILSGAVAGITVVIGAGALEISRRAEIVVREYVAASRQRVGDAAARARLEAGELHDGNGQNQLEGFCRMLERAGADLPPEEQDVVRDSLLNAALHDNAHQAVADLVGHPDPAVRQRQAQMLAAHPSMQALRDTIGDRQDLLLHTSALTLYVRNSNSQSADVAPLGGHERIRDDEEYRLVAIELQRQFGQREPGPSPASTVLLKLSTDVPASDAGGASDAPAANTRAAIRDSAAEDLLDEVIAQVRRERAGEGAALI